MFFINWTKNYYVKNIFVTFQIKFHVFVFKLATLLNMFNLKNDIKFFRKQTSTKTLQKYYDSRKRNISIIFTKKFENESIFFVFAMIFENSFFFVQTKTTKFNRFFLSFSFFRCDFHNQDAVIFTIKTLMTVNVKIDQNVNYFQKKSKTLYCNFNRFKFKISKTNIWK